jgi:hypothetical protein
MIIQGNTDYREKNRVSGSIVEIIAIREFTKCLLVFLACKMQIIEPQTVIVGQIVTE